MIDGFYCDRSKNRSFWSRDSMVGFNVRAAAKQEGSRAMTGEFYTRIDLLPENEFVRWKWIEMNVFARLIHGGRLDPRD